MGQGYFDIRYHILRNPNWTLEEKQRLIMDFWYDDDDYEEALEQWELDEPYEKVLKPTTSKK